MKPRFVVSVAVTAVAAATAITHMVQPKWGIDGTTLGLMILAALPWLAPAIRTLELPGGLKVELREIEDRLARVENVTLEGRGNAGQWAQVRDDLRSFKAYLERLLDQVELKLRLPQIPTVVVADGSDSFLSEETNCLQIGIGMIAEPHVAAHQYAHIVLRHINLDANPSRSNDNVVEAAVADYLACSSDGYPLVGTAEIGTGRPDGAERHRRDLLRQIHWSGLPAGASAHERGEVLASALWDLRTDILDATTCDRLVVKTWMGFKGEVSVSDYVSRLVNGADIRDQKREKVAAAFTERGIPFDRVPDSSQVR